MTADRDLLLVQDAVAHPEKPLALTDLVNGARRIAGPPVTTALTGLEPLGLPAINPAQLGGPGMQASHGLRFPYVCGEMANGIATVRMVEAMARCGMLGFFGAAGLSPDRIEAAVLELKSRCGDRAWGSNLIHSPSEPELEERTADLYLHHGITRVSSSAFMNLRPSIVRYAYSGLRELPTGQIVRANHVFAKISRPEVARQFLSPAPENMLNNLVEKGLLSANEARLARRTPVADHVTVEADSGGHTDNGSMAVLVPAVLALAEDIRAKHGWAEAPLVGASGGIGTPGAVAAAFAMGGTYVMTGSINQCTVESGQSEAAKRLLAQAGSGDVTMAPAGDMFEQGVRVQVLKRGTMFPVRAARLYELYRRYESLEQLPAEITAALEKDYFRQPLASTLAATRAYFAERRPEENLRADRDPKHRMALLFRWYLGSSSRWPLDGDVSRQIDYQIWCGPAMGAFNQWVAGSFLQDIANRTVGEIAYNLMHGAASITRAHQLRACGVAVPPSLFLYAPRPLANPSIA